MRTSSILKLMLGACLAAVGVSHAQAQDYPTKPITLIVGYGPGASTDLMARFTAEHMSQLLGQRIIVENRAGANSAIATRMVARANPDGYTLLFSAFALASNLYGLKEPGYKLSDFVNIGGYGYTGYTLFVNTKSSGAKTAQEFIDFGRKNPGKLTYLVARPVKRRPISLPIISTPTPKWAGAKFRSRAPPMRSRPSSPERLTFTLPRPRLRSVRWDSRTSRCSRSPARSVRRCCRMCRPSPRSAFR